MAYKEKLIEFVIAKNSYIYHNSNMSYITKEDIGEINIWSERICTKIYKYIVDYIYTTNITCEVILNNKTCPWCLYYHYNFSNNCCKLCGYSKRHGICRDDDSNYKKLRKVDAFSSLDINAYIKILKTIEYGAWDDL